MAVNDLTSNVDTTYPDDPSDASVQVHQQDHDEIHDWLKTAGDITASVLTSNSVLDDLSDVTETTITTGDVLRWNGTAWVNYADSNYAGSGHNHDAAYVNEGDHTKAAHDALNIDADTVDGQHASAFADSGHGHDHDALTGFVANEHLDWTADQGATNIHANNITGYSATGHTHTEANITDLDHLTIEEVQDNFGTSFVVGGTNLTATYDDGANTLTLAVDSHNHTEAQISDLDHYTTSDANTDIDARVNKTFVDALNVDADTVDGQHASAFATSGHGHNHDSLSGFVADEHIDWTSDQGATNIHVNNITGYSATGHTHTEANITDLDHYTSTDFDTDFGSKVVTDLSDVTAGGFSNKSMLEYDGTNFIGVISPGFRQVYNNTGSTIPEGTVVAITGMVSFSPSIEVADKDTDTTVAGITTEDIAPTANGLIKFMGNLVADFIDTSGMTGGNPLYLGNNGSYTDIKPTSGNVVRIGSVGRVASVFGSLLLDMPSSATELDDGSVTAEKMGVEIGGVKANLLSNAGFEQGTLTSWTAGSEATVGTSYARTGNYGVRIVTDGTGSGRTLLSQEITGVKPNRRYSVRAWSKSIEWTSYFNLEVLMLDNSDSVLDDVKLSINGDSDWIRTSWSFVTPANTTKMELRISIDFDVDPADMYFDDFQLQEGFDHGHLHGLDDDDHTQYLNVARHDADDHSSLTITESQISDLDHYTTTDANAAIDARVDKAFVDALNVDADTVDGQHASAFATSGHGHSTLTAGSGLSGTGYTGTAAQTWTVDSTVVRTTGAQTIGGVKDFTSNMGLGTSAPNFSLDVNGETRVRGENATRYGGTGASDSKFAIKYNASTESLDFNYVG